jgi:uncharacterized RDD family membrane protein YckC
MSSTSAENLEDLSYAGFWIRLWASVIDSVLVLVATAPILRVIYGRAFDLTGPELRGPADFIVQFVLPTVAVILFWVFRSATPGKMAIGARILDARTGKPASVAQLIVRYLGYYLSLLPLGLGFLWIALDARKQGWHDKLAGTVVVRAREKVHFDERPAT